MAGIFRRERIAENKKFWKWKNLIKKGSLAKAWSAGYTLTLDKFGVDYSEMEKMAGFPRVIGHQKEIKRMERILSEGKTDNCLLVGEPGVGRKSIVLALAQKSLLGESLPNVNNKRIVRLDLSAILSSVEDKRQVENVLDRIFQEATALEM